MGYRKGYSIGYKEKIRTKVMAFLKKRNNVWYAVWYMDGEKIVKTTSMPATQKNKKLAQMMAENMEGIAKGKTIEENAIKAIKATAVAFRGKENVPSVKDYLSTYKVGKTESAQKNYEAAAKEMLKYLGIKALKSLDLLTKENCVDFLKSLESQKEKGTIRTHRSYLAAAFEKARQKGMIDKNPFEGIKMARREDDGFRRESFTEEEMKRLITEPAYPWKEAVKISYYTGGQRLSDVCKMRWEQINFETSTLTIKTKKTKRGMNIPIIAPLMQVLIELRQKNGNSEYVLPELQVRYTRSKGGASTDFTSMLSAMGIGKKVRSGKSGRMQSVKSFHSIRHTAVTALRESELITQDVALEVVGQSELVQRAYSHPSRKKKEAAIKLLQMNLEKPKEQQEQEAANAFVEALKNSDDPQKLLADLLEKLKKA